MAEKVSPSIKFRTNPEQSRRIRAHIFISGLVQGVFFRDFIKRKAEEIGLFGWVKNLPDKRVEAVFEDEKTKVEEMLEWVKKGPPQARVENLEIIWEEHKGEFQDFAIEH